LPVAYRRLLIGLRLPYTKISVVYINELLLVNTPSALLLFYRKAMKRILTYFSCLGVLWATGNLSPLRAQAVGVVPTVLTAAINPSQMVTLSGNTHPLARRQFDQGVAPQDLPMSRILLVLKRSPAQERALEQLLRNQQDQSSSDYHQWLTPEQFGQQFGLAEEDLQKVTSWLQSRGFQIDQVSNGRTLIEFSGTAANVQTAFHTAIHKFIVNGREHWANVSDPQIPAALLPALAGVATLHNFFATPQVAVAGQQVVATLQPDLSQPGSSQVNSPRPQFGSGGSQALAPADYSTIYNIKPLYQAGVNGSGTVIAVVGRTNINVQDVNSFRSTFALPNNSPQVIVNGPNPGNLGGGEEMEAVLDTTWAGAVAPNAQVDLVVSASTNTTDGIFLSEQYIIDHNLAGVMTESFGDCEANYTQSSAAAISSIAQQAAAEGITFVVSTGDSGSAGCDNFNTQNSATGPVSVNVLASTPYTVAVGGTQFHDNANPGQYWSSQNGSGYGSAVSYIPEDVWNNNCLGNQCGSNSILAGGGGRSRFFAKPAWQSGVPGIPNDGARDVPDVALTAAGHDPYLLCLRGSCTPNSSGQISLSAVYGTSASAPSFAGIMALVNQKTGSRQGQANTVLYRLAAGENFGSCNASNTGSLPAGNCIFNDVTVGTNAVPGEPGYNTPNQTYGSGTGYDLASGLGSVNAANLVNGWNGPAPAPAPSPTSTGWNLLVSKRSGKCLNVSGNSSAQAAPLIQWTCGSYDNEYFSFTPVTGGYEVTAKNSGLCLNVSGNSLNDGGPIIQFPYWGATYTNEVWTISAPDSQGYVTLTPVSSGLALSVYNSSLDDAASVIQWTNYSVDAQKWKLVPVQ